MVSRPRDLEAHDAPISTRLLAGAASLTLACCSSAAAPPPVAAAGSGHMQVKSASSLTATKGSDHFFTGSVMVTQLFQATEHTRASGGSVAFQPGARSAWHTHPAGQTLLITSGTGWVQEWGGEKKQIKAGDVVWTPPGVKHWHGASAGEGMTHIAVQEHVGGVAVSWLEQVSDEQYAK